MSNYRSFVFRLTGRVRTLILVSAILVVVLVVVGIIFSYRLGLSSATGLYNENRMLSKDLSQLRESLNDEKVQVAILQKQTEIDQAVVEKVRQDIIEQQGELVKLQKEIAFYRGLVAPGEDESQPGLHDFEVRYDAAANKYYYSLVFKQLGLGKKFLKGKANIFLLWQEVSASPLDGQETPLHRQALSTLPKHTGQLPAKLNFRSFQNIKGMFELPEGVEVSGVEVDFTFSDKNSLPSPVLYDWQALLQIP